MRRAVGRLGRRIARLPAPAVAGLALLGVGVVAFGAVYGYRTWDWIEHDNEFCLSCHLMVDPYDRFAESAHRGLGCKACHKPTFAARSQMALTQVIENPDSLAAHAEVPNEKCTSCHVDGDPERWESIRTSAGHRIHFESADSSLQGLRCVECHSTSVHQFAATDETCAQSGCHTDVEVRLGGMSDLTIHCVACHGFSTPVEGAGVDTTLVAALRPEAEECLSCHVMRSLVDMPPDEPHGGACGLCHDPHRQATPEEAVESCATASCHVDPGEATPFHRGLDRAVLEDCSRCHVAHDFPVDGGDCAACHGDPDGEAGGAGAAGRRSARSGAPPAAGSRLHAGAGPVRFAGLGHPSPPGPAAHAPQATDSTFRHGEHRGVACAECHDSSDSHGAVSVTSLADCRSCHHAGRPRNDCASCHDGADPPLPAATVRRPVTLSVGGGGERDIPFDHAPHVGIGCADCHTSGLALGADTASCAACHVEHHEPDVRCASCHLAPPDDAHSVEAHLGCAGAGCHDPVPAAVASVPRTRALCVACHQDLEDHRPGRTCVACHPLPDVRTGGAGGGR